MTAQDLDTFVADKLLAGNQQVQTKSVIVDTGVLPRGTVLGKIKIGTVPSTGTVAGTGNGTCTGVIAGRRVIPGTYVAKCRTAVTNGGVFEVRNPNNVVLGLATVGFAFTSDEINFTINDGATDFVVGDTHSVIVPAGTGKYVKCDKAVLDGSGVADSILAEAVDATSADVTTIAYKTGQFNRAALTFAAGNTYADHEADLRLNDINLIATVIPS